MVDESQRSGRIVANRISAENVVSGIQSPPDVQPEQLLALARELRTGSIDVSEIEARNVVSGLQLLTAQTTDELIQGVRELRTDLQQLEPAEVSLLDENEHADAVAALGQIEESLESSGPVHSRVFRLMRNVNDVLDNGSVAAEKAGKLTTTLSGLALQAAALWQSVQHLFG